MRFVPFIARSYLIIDKMIEVLDIVGNTTENSSLYRESYRLLYQVYDIKTKSNYQMRWFDSHPDLVRDLYRFCLSKNIWQQEFSEVYLRYYGDVSHGKDRELARKNLEELFADIKYIRRVLSDILESRSDPHDVLSKDIRDFYCDLNKYVLKPERIERFSEQFGMEFFDYLDAIFGIELYD